MHAPDIPCNYGAICNGMSIRGYDFLQEMKKM
jgi:hypothetical protein